MSQAFPPRILRAGGALLLLAAAAGTPAVYLRQPTDTSKGQMWRDVGLSDWIFEIDAATGDAIARPLLAFANDPAGSRQRLAEAKACVERRFAETARVVRQAAG